MAVICLLTGFGLVRADSPMEPLFRGVKKIIFRDGYCPVSRDREITEPSEIAAILRTIRLISKEPCECVHVQEAVFIGGKETITVSLCDHCFNVERKGRVTLYAMPPAFYRLFTGFIDVR